MIVKYSKKFNTGPWLNEDIGFETEVPATIFDGDEETILLALSKLKLLAEKFHKDNNPQLVEGVKMDFSQHEYGLNVTAPVRQQPPSIDYKAKEKLEIDIDNATSKDDLQLLWDKAVEYHLKEQYENKLKVLSK